LRLSSPVSPSMARAVPDGTKRLISQSMSKRGAWGRGVHRGTAAGPAQVWWPGHALWNPVGERWLERKRKLRWS
jgi:hypothetical protein